MEQNKVQVFEDQPIRTAWDEENEEWYFAIVDVISVLTESKDPAAYWRKLKQRLKEEGNESVTNCHGLKLLSRDNAWYQSVYQTSSGADDGGEDGQGYGWRAGLWLCP